MVTYVSLINWTDQGIRSFTDTVKRAREFRSLAESNGGQVRELLWTVGECDIVAVVDFPDEETATALLLKVGALGNVRTRSMRGFDEEAMERIIAKAG
ncbi:MAG TPA: GYD domain-containing protein [Egibacteraceae bacterium]|jgi:uncharacterized protein with GYD domain|nr:GYD domain-containing protein [Egibacteraceae bacterium]